VCARGHGSGGGVGGSGLLTKNLPCGVRRSRRRYWRRHSAAAAHAQSRPNDTGPSMTSSSSSSMTSSSPPGRCCQLAWCSADKLPPPHSAAVALRPPRASFWTPRARHVTKPEAAAAEAAPLFATPTSVRAPTYDFVFDVGTAAARAGRPHCFRPPCCPPSCHVTGAALARSSAGREAVLSLANAHRYVEGTADDDNTGRRQRELVNSA